MLNTAINTRGSDVQRRRLSALKTERASFDPLYRDISRMLLPMAGRFATSRRNQRRDSSIIDQTGSQAHKILISGMMAGMTSPARPWHRLQTTDPALNDHGPVKKWLDDVNGIVRDIFTTSNFYRTQATRYGEITSFGTTASLDLDHYENVVHFYPLTTGQFWIAQDQYGQVDTLYRQSELTVENLVAEYGLENVSQTVKNLYDRGQYDATVKITQAIEPRKERDHTRRDNVNMRWRSCAFEDGENNTAYLRESGFQSFPARVARWDLLSEDIYGTDCPGIDSLRAIEQLQLLSIDKGKAIQHMSNPAIAAPAGIQLRDTLPGGVATYTGELQTVRNLRDVRIDLGAVLNDIHDVRQRLDTHFYADLFQMINRSQDRQRTATEIAERHEEKLLMLGPVLERLNHEDLSPAIKSVFHRAFNAGMLPQVPPEMSGADIKIEFVSIMAQAQKLVGLTSMDQLLVTIGNVAQLKPNVVDKLNHDVWVDKAADILGVDPDLIVANDQVALIRQERSQQAQAQQTADMIPVAAQAARTLSETDVRKPSALTNMHTQL